MALVPLGLRGMRRLATATQSSVPSGSLLYPMTNLSSLRGRRLVCKKLTAGSQRAPSGTSPVCQASPCASWRARVLKSTMIQGRNTSKSPNGMRSDFRASSFCCSPCSKAMAGLWCTALGWGHEELVDAATRQMRRSRLTTKCQKALWVVGASRSCPGTCPTTTASQAGKFPSQRTPVNASVSECVRCNRVESSSFGISSARVDDPLVGVPALQRCSWYYAVGRSTVTSHARTLGLHFRHLHMYRIAMDA